MPRYLVLDEPTSQLDPLGTRLVSETLATAAKSTGVGILIVEHKTQMLANLCDEVMVLADGMIVARGPAAEVLGDPALGGWGVTPPPSVALRRAVEAAGLEWQANWLLTTPRGISLGTDGLGFSYPGGARALSDVSMTIAAGSRVAIIGQNGSGKSTLVRHFNGLLRASEGRVLVDGREVGREHVANLARLVGITFQNPDRQIFAGKVRAEVAFGPRNLGLRGGALDDRVARALAMVGLTDEAETNPYDLGFSERKLLALGSVVAMGTPAIVLDEPTTGQDANGIARVRGLVAELAADGRTVIAVSHDMSFVAESFERVLVLRDGKLILDGTVAEVFAEHSWPALESTYLEPPLPARLGARLGLGSTPTSAAFVEALTAS